MVQCNKRWHVFYIYIFSTSIIEHISHPGLCWATIVFSQNITCHLTQWKRFKFSVFDAKTSCYSKNICILVVVGSSFALQQ